MDQLERLKDDIKDSRDDLQGNLRELERKVGDVTDWRYQFSKRPFVLMGAAAAGGAFLGILVGHRRSAMSLGAVSTEEAIRGVGGVAHDLVPQAWDTIKAALIGLAASRLQDVVEEMLPGFKEHYRAAEQRTTGFVRAV